MTHLTILGYEETFSKSLLATPRHSPTSSMATARVSLVASLRDSNPIKKSCKSSNPANPDSDKKYLNQ